MNFSTEWTIPSGERSFRSIYGVLPRSQEEAYFVLPLFPAPYSNGRKPDRGIPIPDRKRGSGLLRPNPREPDYRTRGRQLRLRVLRVLFRPARIHPGGRAGNGTRKGSGRSLSGSGSRAHGSDLFFGCSLVRLYGNETCPVGQSGRLHTRISTGKLTRSGDRLTMPVSLDVHHGFIDGRQAGEFFALLENRE